MATASELFLARLRYSLVIGGMMTRNACGSTIGPHPLTRFEAKRGRRLALSPADRKNAGADDLGDEAAGVDSEADQQRDEFREGHRAADEVEPLKFGPLEPERRTSTEKHYERQTENQRGADQAGRELCTGQGLPAFRPTP